MKLIQRIGLAYYRTKFKLLSLISPKIAARSAFHLFCTPYTRRKVLPEPKTFALADKIFVDHDGYHVKGFHWKPDNSNGHKILICHGFDSRTYNFEKYVNALLEKKFEVLAFDAPAHGLSSGDTITAKLYKEVIQEINKKYGPVGGIISHSFGGLAAALAVEEMENRDTKQLVLIAPATETTTAIENFFSHIPVSKKTKAEFENLIVNIGKHPSSWYSVSRIVQEIKTRTLWIHDKTDTITPYADMQHLPSLNLPNVKFEITEGLGHSAIYRNAEVIKKVVAFLAELH